MEKYNLHGSHKMFGKYLRASNKKFTDFRVDFLISNGGGDARILTV
jgi:hypothetical protein